MIVIGNEFQDDGESFINAGRRGGSRWVEGGHDTPNVDPYRSN